MLSSSFYDRQEIDAYHEAGYTGLRAGDGARSKKKIKAQQIEVMALQNLRGHVYRRIAVVR